MLEYSFFANRDILLKNKQLVNNAYFLTCSEFSLEFVNRNNLSHIAKAYKIKNEKFNESIFNMSSIVRSTTQKEI